MFGTSSAVRLDSKKHFKGAPVLDIICIYIYIYIYIYMCMYCYYHYYVY